jgi:hypothetical protein
MPLGEPLAMTLEKYLTRVGPMPNCKNMKKTTAERANWYMPYPDCPSLEMIYGSMIKPTTTTTSCDIQPLAEFKAN